MLLITADDISAELTTGTRYERETVPKYYLKFADGITAAVYKSGVVKSVGDVELVTLRTMGGVLVTLETDIKTGGYITLSPTPQQTERFMKALLDLDTIRRFVLSGGELKVVACERMEYEPEVPSDADIAGFFRGIKGPAELEAIASRLNDLLGPMDIVHPSVGDLDYLAFSLCQGCDGGCAKCSFQHTRTLMPRSGHEVLYQTNAYREMFTPQELARFEIFAGNHRGLGIDFELFCSHIRSIRAGAGVGGQVFTFCNAEDVVRLHEQYEAAELESRMVGMGMHLNFGVESGSCKGLQEYGKNIGLATIKKALVLLKATKIPYSVNILSGVGWEQHAWETVKLFRSLYRPGDNRPTVYSSAFIDETGRIDRSLAAEQYKIFRNALNDCGIHVFRYTFVPFNRAGG